MLGPSMLLSSWRGAIDTTPSSTRAVTAARMPADSCCVCREDASSPRSTSYIIITRGTA